MLRQSRTSEPSVRKGKAVTLRRIYYLRQYDDAQREILPRMRIESIERDPSNPMFCWVVGRSFRQPYPRQYLRDERGITTSQGQWPGKEDSHGIE